ncbi:MAG: sodium:proton antiporter [Spirochaetes bacterium]|nr:sodium:proton antiporter [Spirochaetota bacterium]
MNGTFLLASVVFLPMLSSVIAYAIGRKNEGARDAFAISAVAVNFLLCIVLAMQFYGTEIRLPGYAGLALHFRVDGFRALYGSITGFLWLVTTLFSPEYFAHSQKRNRYWLFNLLTYGATMGVFFSADLRTTFLFFEIMSFTSYALVAHDESSPALRAAETFLAVAVIGGLSVLMGMMMLHARLGTLEFVALREISMGLTDKSQLYLPGALMLAGFGGKAGMYPLHIWLPKAHPVAPAPASALLSGILTKTGVFGVIVLSTTLFLHDYNWGAILLIPASITMLLGAVLGIFSNDLKRTLACSSVSQIGFILTGIAMQVLLGEENALAVRGTVLHMLNHSLFKLVLFVSAGIVYLNRHELALDKIRGFGRGKPLFLFAFLMAALGISGLPLWSGYVSKTLLNEGIYAGIYLYAGQSLELPLRWLDRLFKFTGFLTAAYMTKLFVALFIERGDSDSAAHGHEAAHGAGHGETHGDHAGGKGAYMSRPFAVALTVSAALIPVLGFSPALMEGLAARAQDFFHSSHVPYYGISYFSLYKMQGKIIGVLAGIAIYIVIVRGLMMRRKAGGVRLYTDWWPRRLDLEFLIYRPVLGFLVWLASRIAKAAVFLVDETLIYRPFLAFLARTAGRIANGAVLLADDLAAKFSRHISKQPHEPGKGLVQSFRAAGGKLHDFWVHSEKIGEFSTSLLFIGIGISIAVIYVFSRALQ